MHVLSSNCPQAVECVVWRATVVQYMIQSIFQTVKSSFHDRAFYAALPPGRRAFGALALIAAFTGILVSVPASIAFYQFLRSNYLETIPNAFHAELVIEIDGGIASSSVSQPYYIAMPGATSSSSPQHLAVIDTRPAITLAELDTYDAAMVLTQKKLFYMSDEGGESRVIDLESFDGVHIDRKVVMDLAGKIKPFISGMLYVLPVLLFFLIIFGMLAYYALIALPSALIVKIIAKIKGFSIPYGAAYRTALFALIPVAIASIITGMLGVSYPMLFGLVVFILVISANIQKSTTAE